MGSAKTKALLRYLEIFKSAGPFEELEVLFHPTMRFRGPLFSADNAASYIEALRRDPPQGVDYDLISSFENDQEALLVIDFIKASERTPMVVWGKFSDDRIKALTLIFDSGTLR